MILKLGIKANYAINNERKREIDQKNLSKNNLRFLKKIQSTKGYYGSCEKDGLIVEKRLDMIC